MSHLAAILFDVDGTLIATRRLYVEALADALEPVLGSRLREHDIMALGPKAERRFLREHAGDAIEEVLDAFYRSYRARHHDLFEGVYEGILELLVELRARDVPLGLVTGKSRRAWEITAPFVGLGEFPVVILDDDVPAPKPDPAGLRLATRRLDTPPERTIYVGDSLTDLDAARAAGMRAAGALWSKKSEEVITFREASGARGAHPLEKPMDLLELLPGEDGSGT